MIAFNYGFEPDQVLVAASYGDTLRTKGQPATAVFWQKRAVNLLRSLRAGMKDLEASTQAAFLASKRGELKCCHPREAGWSGLSALGTA